MGNKGGRPKKSAEAKTRTKHIRVMEDLAEMISEICEATGDSTPKYLDAIIRPAIMAKYEQLKPMISKIRTAKEEIRKVVQENRQE